MEYTRLENLKAQDYFYPDEDRVFNQIRRIPLLEKLMGQYVALGANFFARPQAQADTYRVTEKTCPKIYALFERAKARLDINEDIPLFIKPDFDFNACAYGGSAPFVMIHSSFIKNCSDTELLYVLGHELGHLKGKHAEHQQAIIMLINEILANSGIAHNLMKTLGESAMLLLQNWARMMEYSADRAGAIASGGPENAIYGIQTLLGIHENMKGIHVTGADLLAQSNMFDEKNQSKVAKLIMLKKILNSSHPWAIHRIQELHKWKESGEFDELIRNKAVY